MFLIVHFVPVTGNKIGKYFMTKVFDVYENGLLPFNVSMIVAYLCIQRKEVYYNIKKQIKILAVTPWSFLIFKRNLLTEFSDVLHCCNQLLKIKYLYRACGVISELFC